MQTQLDIVFVIVTVANEQARRIVIDTCRLPDGEKNRAKADNVFHLGVLLRGDCLCVRCPDGNTAIGRGCPRVGKGDVVQARGRVTERARTPNFGTDAAAGPNAGRVLVCACFAVLHGGVVYCDAGAVPEADTTTPSITSV